MLQINAFCLASDMLHKVTIIDLLLLFAVSSLLSYSCSSIWVYFMPPSSIHPPSHQASVAKSTQQSFQG